MHVIAHRLIDLSRWLGALTRAVTRFSLTGSVRLATSALSRAVPSPMS